MPLTSVLDRAQYFSPPYYARWSTETEVQEKVFETLAEAVAFVGSLEHVFVNIVDSSYRLVASPSDVVEEASDESSRVLPRRT